MTQSSGVRQQSDNISGILVTQNESSVAILSTITHSWPLVQRSLFSHPALRKKDLKTDQKQQPIQCHFSHK